MIPIECSTLARTFARISVPLDEGGQHTAGDLRLRFNLTAAR
jgi:hypothetical protein